eukprot:109469_1
MERQFKCSLTSDVKIRYYFNYCNTEDSDKWHLYKLNSSNNSDTIRSDGMSMNDGKCDCLHFHDYETGNTWKNDLPTGNSYPGGIDDKCNDTHNFKYQMISWQNMGWQNAGTTFQVRLSNYLSSTTESTYLFN